MSRILSDQVALARDNVDKPDRFPQRNIEPTVKLSPIARFLLSAHVTIASSWKSLWWTNK